MNIKSTLGILCVCLLISCSRWKGPVHSLDKLPPIFPDYISTIIPYNIAPLNFEVKGAKHIQALFSDGEDDLLRVIGDSEICIPESDWKKMLLAMKGKPIQVVISVWNDSFPEGVEYAPFLLHVAPDAIDEWIAYRLIEPGYEGWNMMGIYQRCLSSFVEKEIVVNSNDKTKCINCHSFAAYSPKEMMFHVRGKGGGTALWIDGNLTKLDFAQIAPKLSGSYPVWHPKGRYLLFSSNTTRQSFYSEGEQQIEVYDLRSDLLVYDTQTQKVMLDDRFTNDQSWETFPTWGADGNSIYFCTATPKNVPVESKHLHYSLCKVNFDIHTGRWGSKVDTLYQANHLGGSISFPRISPDGKYLLCTRSAFGTFPINHPEADLLLMDAISGKPIDTAVLNSSDADSYHAWSSNGRWIIFSSRRLDGRYTRLFIAWMDMEGKLHKPFLLPQQHPSHNMLRMKSYNVPEFIKDEVCLPADKLNELFFNSKE